MRPGWWAAAGLLIAGLLSPMLFTTRSFDPDWTNHLWVVAAQRENLRLHGLPSLFLHASGLGVFYPQFAFYGGTLYSVTAYLALVIGATPAYVATFGVGFAAILGGWWWLGRQLGLSTPVALIPGAIHATAPYVMANAYGRGAWPEFMATAALPLVCAAGLALLRARRPSAAAAVALALSSVLLTGSHNITLVWGVTFLALLACAAAIAAGRTGLVHVRPGRVALVVGLFAVGPLVNAWFLLPDLLYASRLQLDRYDNGAGFFNRLSVVLDPVRSVPSESTSPGLTVQAPVIALAAGILALGGARPWRVAGSGWILRGAGVVTALLLGFLVLVLRDDPTVGQIGQGAWERLPGFLRYVQFAFRLESYVTILVCGLVLLGLVAAGRLAPGRRRTLVVVPAAFAALLGAYQAVHQAWSQPSFRADRAFVYRAGPHQVPISWADAGNFRDRSAAVVPAPARPRLLLSPEAMARSGTATATVPRGRGPLPTNIATGSDLIRVDGLRVVGRGRHGYRVVARPTGSRVRVDVVPRGGAIRDGRLLSVLGLLALVAAPVAVGRRGKAMPTRS